RLLNGSCAACGTASRENRRRLSEEPDSVAMKYSGTLWLLAGLIALTVWWQWPDWGRRAYWFPEDRIITRASCRKGQLTTMSPHEGGGLSPVALNEIAALAVFEKPVDLLEPFSQAKFERELADIHKRVERFFALIAQGHLVRIPKEKLV